MTRDQKRDPITFKEGREALLLAQKKYLAFRAEEAQLDGVMLTTFEPDRLAFNRLEKACEELIAALHAFDRFDGDLQGNYQLLVDAMRDRLGVMAPRDDYDRVLDAMHESAELVAHAAADARDGPVQGVHKAEAAFQWIWFAAEHWETIGGAVAAGTNSPFWEALDAFQRDKNAIDHRMPVVGNTQARNALKNFKSRKAVLGGGTSENLPTP